ncbi:hypothetical protein H0H92_006562 [Tricholoma furcatifolium]|nr:hypothetical protein H0H92_006562 [Tricholoma furcatifolium]
MFFKAFLTHALAFAIGYDVVTEAAPNPFNNNAGAIAFNSLPFDPSDNQYSIFFQTSSGTINGMSLSNPYYPILNETIVPASEARVDTPITVAVTSDDDIHVFFISADNFLSEYYLRNDEWNGGSGCKTCVTASKLSVAAGTRFLSAAVNSTSDTIVVGFVAAKDDDTITLATKKDGKWSAAPLKPFTF